MLDLNHSNTRGSSKKPVFQNFDPHIQTVYVLFRSFNITRPNHSISPVNINHALFQHHRRPQRPGQLHIPSIRVASSRPSHTLLHRRPGRRHSRPRRPGQRFTRPHRQRQRRRRRDWSSHRAQQLRLPRLPLRLQPDPSRVHRGIHPRGFRRHLRGDFLGFKHRWSLYQDRHYPWRSEQAYLAV